ncbi:hypothetical protein KEM52_005079 [Ascosphaera acerosa]|nr:hypothetical protein KEM52_005079 [Ascosphaera acerosa]
MAEQQQKAGGTWSSKNPIPKVGEFADKLRSRKAERQEFDEQVAQDNDEEARQHGHQQPQPSEAEGEGGGLQPSGDGVDQAQQAGGADDEVKPHPEVRPHRQYRKVTDPTTGKEIQIDDVDKDFLKALESSMVGEGEQMKYPKWQRTLKKADPHWQASVPNANLGKPTPVKTSPDQSFEKYKENQDITAPPDPIAQGTTSDVPIHGEKTNILFHPTPSITYESFFRQLERRTYAICGGCAAAIFIIGKLGGCSWKMLFILVATANLIPESVEWINSFLAVIWNIIDPEVFSSVADTIEDVMQASIPRMIENVRVAEIDQGANPIRILSMRALPDDHMINLKRGAEQHAKETVGEEQAAVEKDMGVFYNLEASFAYHAKPSGALPSSKAENLHMLLVFYLGVKKLFGVPLPIFVELLEFVGTVRIRIQMTPDPPFARAATISLMGCPHIRAGCTPMIKQGINILQLPVISNFVNYAIATAANLYVAPKSLSVDLRMLLQGDDVEKDTDALGVIWVWIHRARELSKQDTRGSVGGGSDAYINLSFSKYEKPMYCTRVIVDDLNPIWEESAALLVSPELIKADEELSVELWDSDRTTADDVVGKISMPIKRMVQQPGKMFLITSKLSGMNEGSEMPGVLEWEAGFFGKPQFRKSMRTDGKARDLPKTLADRPDLQDDKGKINSEQDHAVEHTPPDPLWPSGICSIVLHQIVNLELEEIKGTYRHRKGNEYDAARKYGENKGETGNSLPTSYCNVHINDSMVHRTRSKAVTANPIFNTSIEHFVRDWRSTIITIAVRDKRFRQHDPLLGVVPLKLSDLFQKASQVTRWYPLDGGIGFGRMRVSVLFRSVDLRLPPQLLGWDVGTFQVYSDEIYAEGYRSTGRLTIHTSGVTTQIGRTHCYDMEEGTGKYFVKPSAENHKPLILPTRSRYRSAIIFQIHGTPRGWSVLWLKDYSDNEVIDVSLPIWRAKMHARLTGNYITESNCEEKRYPGLEDLEIIGRLKFQFRFMAGLHEVFHDYIRSNDDRETIETWEACIAEGVRDREVSKDLPPALQELYDKSLLADRDAVKGMSEKEQDELFKKAGIDKPAFLEGDRATMEKLQRQLTRAVGAPKFEEGVLPRPATPGKDDDQHDVVSKRRAKRQGGEKNPVQPGHGTDDRTEAAAGAATDTGDDDARNGSTDTAESGSGSPSSSTGSGDGGQLSSKEAKKAAKDERRRAKRSERRKHRGSMQWAPVRSAAFIKNEAKFGMEKVKSKLTGGLQGREPDVETET